MRYLIIIFLLTSCKPGLTNFGYYIDEKPLRGTGQFNKNNIRPYWQCVDGVKNIICKD